MHVNGHLTFRIYEILNITTDKRNSLHFFFRFRTFIGTRGAHTHASDADCPNGATDRDGATVA